MASDPLGIFLSSDKSLFPFAVFNTKRGLNFLEDTSLFTNPITEYNCIGPRALVEWSEE